jgi:hypothetical protein
MPVYSTDEGSRRPAGRQGTQAVAAMAMTAAVLLVLGVEAALAAALALSVGRFVLDALGGDQPPAVS